MQKSRLDVKLKISEHSLNAKTYVTPAILSRNFVAQLYRATKSQVWHGVSRNFSTVAQLLFRLEQRSILCVFCATLSRKCGERWLVNYYLCDRKSCSVRHAMSHLRHVWRSRFDGIVNFQLGTCITLLTSMLDKAKTTPCAIINICRLIFDCNSHIDFIGRFLHFLYAWKQ